MKNIMITRLSTTLLIIFLITGYAFAMDGMKPGSSDKIGDLIHESVVDGYTLSYYFMDLRDRKHDAGSMEKMDPSHDMAGDSMKKPHHLMVYIMDRNHKPALKGKVGFLIKDVQGNKQTEMGMFMSDGFGATADMKKKGTYTIVTKVVLDGKTLKDSFSYEIN